MTRLVWDSPKDRPFRSGLDHGILFSRSDKGVVWNGLVSVEESSEGSEIVIGYFDGIPYTQQRNGEGFKAVLSAYTYPDEFSELYSFGLSYRVQVDLDYEIHLVYNALAYSRNTDYDSLQDDATAALFNWSIATVPMLIPGHKPSSHIIVSSSKTNPPALAALEELLYGTESTDSRLPLPEEVLEIFDANAILIITDNGDGSWSAEGPSSMIQMIDATSFRIETPSARYLSDDTYEIWNW